MRSQAHTPPRSVGVGIAALCVLAVVRPHEFPVGTIAQGALAGMLLGLLSVGLVITYRVSRVINFAYGSTGALAASLAVNIYLGRGGNWLQAILTAVLAGAAAGAAAGWLVSRRFARSPRLVVTVATIGLSQVFGALAILLPRWVGGPPQVLGGFETGLSRHAVRIDPVLFTANDLAILLIVPVVVVFAALALGRTDAGRAVRAVADNEDRVKLLGIPARRLVVSAWAACGAVAGLASILQSPREGVATSAIAGPILLLTPLAGAVAARMESPAIAFRATLILGVVQSLIALNVDKQAVQSVVTLGVIVLTLAFQRSGSSRSASASTWSAAEITRAVPVAFNSLPEVRVARALALVLPAGVAILAWATLRPDQLSQWSAAVVFAIAALSLTLLSGWAGSVSLGQMALAGTGAVIAGALVEKINLDYFQALALGGLAGATAAVVLGAPALKVSGEFLAVTTLAFAVAAEQFFFNPTNFPTLLPDAVIRPVVWKRFDLADERSVFTLVVCLLALSLLLVSWASRARTGRVTRAVRDNVRAAEAASVPSMRTKLAAFTASGFLAGVAGALNVMLFGSVTFTSFPAGDSLVLFSVAVIGGLSSAYGVVLSALLIQAVGIALPEYQILITGSGVILVLAAFPNGLAGLGLRLRDALIDAVLKRRGISTSVWGSGQAESPQPDVVARSIEPASARLTGTNGPHDAAIVIDGLTASYGSLQVLFGVDLVVEHGAIVALLGTNGAGKSSVLKALTGLLPVGSGHIDVHGKGLRRITPESAAREGLALVPGGRGVFPSLSVTENLRLAGWMHRRDRRGTETLRDEVLALFPRLRERAEIRAGMLSGGEQQQLNLAMALMTRPTTLCIDELSLGLSPVMVSRLVQAVRDINRNGVTVLVVEQSINTACLLADTAVFMEKGRVRYFGPTAELRERPDLLRAVFLAAVDSPSVVSDVESTRVIPVVDPATAPTAPTAPTEIALRTVDLHKAYGGVSAVDGVCLEVRQGEVLGLIGHNGAGKTTLFDLISGFQDADSGSILLGDVELAGQPAHIRSLAGLGRSFQEANLFPTLTVEETVLVALDRRLPSHDPVAASLALPASLDSEALGQEEARRVISMLGLDEYRDTPTGLLSTGTRRIVDLACVLAHRPEVLLLDEPTGGVAKAEGDALARLISRVVQETGCSVVLIDHDMELMQKMCHRLVALESGRVIADGAPADVLSHPAVIASYLGEETAVG